MQALGFINAFDELADSDPRLGRKVANYGLVSALLEYSSADELHFFLPFYGAAQAFERGYSSFLKKNDNEKRVKLLSALGLPAHVRRNSYLAVHAAELDRYFPEMCHLRNQWAREPFPLTCTPHTLSYWSTQLRNIYKVLPGVRAYDAIFCTSQAAKEHLRLEMGKIAQNLRALGLSRAGYKGRLDVIPLGVRASDFAAVSREEALKTLGLPAGVPTLLCLGRLTPFDKFDLAPLIGILWLLNQKEPVRLLLAGAEQRRYGRQIMAFAQELGLGERVFLFADFASSLKPCLLAACDIFVSPADNIQETFGLSLLEAMAAGKPVVAADFSGYRDLVRHGQSGFLVPTLRAEDMGPIDALWPLLPEHMSALQVAQRTPLDMDAWLGYLKLLLGDGNLRLQMGEAGQRRIRELFDWKVVVGRMEEQWKALKAEALRAEALRAGGGTEETEENVFNLSFKEMFGHFMSGSLPLYRNFKAGPLAELFKKGQWGTFPNTDLGGAFNPGVVKTVLDFVESQGGASLMDLYQASGGEMPAFQMEHLCLWALKYGILSQE
ncbi:MAG: glycosyltransferase family 4 protein [Desulfarculales bacterium]|jgi:glycosyltransferase involved in cell wall biosynthesis|nr:glycosyltransferase family 4 protein [Desulfarculales bacterium]